MSNRYFDDNVLLEIKRLYSVSDSRLIIFDYDGTLMPFTKYPDQAIISLEVIDIINKFAGDPINKVFIISGRDRHFLDIQFWNMNVTLIAEHGYLIKAPGEKWKKNILPDTAWKKESQALLEKYKEFCKGTEIEEKESSLVWHFRNANDDCVALKIEKLKDEIRQIIISNPTLQILEGNKILEIKSNQFNKGSVMMPLLKNGQFGFILAVGDDVTDEDLFTIMPEKAITIKIGEGTTSARYIIKEQSQIYELLKNLI
jgi:trehalose 6-phosphate synthase/phosphatase